MPWVLSGSNLGPDVLELGPGPGLTTDLLKTAVPRLTAIELDPQLAASLRARRAGARQRWPRRIAARRPRPRRASPRRRGRRPSQRAAARAGVGLRQQIATRIFVGGKADCPFQVGDRRRPLAGAEAKLAEVRQFAVGKVQPITAEAAG